MLVDGFMSLVWIDAEGVAGFIAIAVLLNGRAIINTLAHREIDRDIPIARLCRKDEPEALRPGCQFRSVTRATTLTIAESGGEYRSHVV